MVYTNFLLLDITSLKGPKQTVSIVHTSKCVSVDNLKKTATFIHKSSGYSGNVLLHGTKPELKKFMTTFDCVVLCTIEPSAISKTSTDAFNQELKLKKKLSVFNSARLNDQRSKKNEAEAKTSQHSDDPNPQAQSKLISGTFSLLYHIN